MNKNWTEEDIIKAREMLDKAIKEKDYLYYPENSDRCILDKFKIRSQQWYNQFHSKLQYNQINKYKGELTW